MVARDSDWPAWKSNRYNLRMRVLRLTVASFLLLWLPLQAIAAIAMPFCAHPAHAHPSGHALVATSEGEGHAVDRSGSPWSNDSGHHHEEGGGSFPMNCNECGACHLACSPTAPGGAVVVADQAPGAVYAEFSPTLPPLFVPEQRKRPPLAAIA